MSILTEEGGKGGKCRNFESMKAGHQKCWRVKRHFLEK